MQQLQSKHGSPRSSLDAQHGCAREALALCQTTDQTQLMLVIRCATPILSCGSHGPNEGYCGSLCFRSKAAGLKRTLKVRKPYFLGCAGSRLIRRNSIRAPSATGSQQDPLQRKKAKDQKNDRASDATPNLTCPEIRKKPSDKTRPMKQVKQEQPQAHVIGMGAVRSKCYASEA